MNHLPRRPLALVLLAGLVGCAEGTLSALASPDEPAPPAADRSADDPHHGSPAPPQPSEPAPGSPPPEQTPPPDAPSGSGAEIPCDVATILDSQCVSCHDETPRYGAPMSLRTWDALHAAALTDPSRAVYELLAERAAHETRPMPPPPNPPLTPDEVETLRAWASQGAPAGAACDEPPPTDPGVAPAEPPPEETCDHDIELRAHFSHGPEDGGPFRVPRATDHYECFYFRPPWNGDAHGLSFRPLVGDDRVLHHWLLYVQEGAVFTDGDHDQCNGRHEDAALVAGWAPGGQPYELPDGVGMHLPSGQNNMFVLEIHYNNSAGYADALDRSGVRICATEDRRPNTAGMQWLGTEGLLMALPGRHERSGTCRPNLAAPVHILSSSPHMHRRGVRLRTEIHRVGGGVDVLIDEPFAFENQIIYDTPATVNPGDSLVTTCTFEHEGGLTNFGPGTDDEMCYNFVVAWPHGALSTGGSLTGAENACLR